MNCSVFPVTHLVAGLQSSVVLGFPSQPLLVTVPFYLTSLDRCGRPCSGWPFSSRGFTEAPWVLCLPIQLVCSGAEWTLQVAMLLPLQPSDGFSPHDTVKLYSSSWHRATIAKTGPTASCSQDRDWLWAFDHVQKRTWNMTYWGSVDPSALIRLGAPSAVWRPWQALPTYWILLKSQPV